VSSKDDGLRRWKINACFLVTICCCGVVCSMFVLLEDRTKDEAFVIGQEIADAVTNDNPKPVKLKLEKVMCVVVLK